MGMTPEGRVKKVVSRLLQDTPEVYYYMPVPGGYGGTTLDYVVCHRGRFCGIETKAPGKKPTARQKQIIAAMERAGGKTFVIDSTDDETMQPLKDWLTSK